MLLALLFLVVVHRLQEIFLYILFTEGAEADEGMPNITSGDENVAIGDEALNANTSGSNNTAVGDEALKSNTTGLKNTASWKKLTIF